jgi:hypothetical protein
VNIVASVPLNLIAHRYESILVLQAAEQLFGLSGGIIVGLELEEPSSASSTAITSVEQVRVLALIVFHQNLEIADVVISS